MGIYKLNLMKNYIILLLSISCAFAPRLCSAQASAHSQSIRALDTIYANDSKNVALFFPEPIRQGITGSDNFVFSYNREKEQYFGLLQAKPGKESNLLVVNRNGAIFSYIVKYRKQLSKLNYFIPLAHSIGNEKPLAKDSTAIAGSEKQIDNRNYYYQKFGAYLLERKRRKSLKSKSKASVVLSVERIVFDKEELYVVLEVNNKSSLDYDLNFLKVYIETEQKGKRKSVQRIYKEPVIRYNLPDKVKEGKRVRMVYVLPKFSLSNDRRVMVELNEKDGERDIKLKLSHRHINNPN